MMPHTRKAPLSSIDRRRRLVKLAFCREQVFLRIWRLKRERARLHGRFPRRKRSAELACYKRRDATTQGSRFSPVLSFREHADDWFGSRRPHEQAALSVELGVQARNLVGDRLRKLLARDADVLLHLWVARHDGHCFREPASVERAAEEQAGGEAVSRH